MSPKRSRSTLVLFLISICCCCIVAIKAEDAPLRVPPLCTEQQCHLNFRCDPYYSGPLVWTVVDGVCRIYKTDCLFASANCDRENHCMPKMISTTQVECQQHCASNCENLPHTPVCAIFPYVTSNGDHNDAQMSFLNQCELDKWTCWNSKAYSSASLGNCQ